MNGIGQCNCQGFIFRKSGWFVYLYTYLGHRSRTFNRFNMDIIAKKKNVV